MTRNRGAQMLGVGIVILALALLVAALRIPGDASYARIGAGVFPALVGVGLIVAGVMFVRAASRGEVAAPAPPVSHAPMIWIVGGLALATALLLRAGFPLAVALLFTMTARGLGSRRWLRSALIGLAIGLVIYAVFSYGLGVSLPAGMFSLVEVRLSLQLD